MSDDVVDGAFDFEVLRSLVAFAYAQGYHELGYDPVKEIEGRVKAAESLLADLQERSDEYVLGSQRADDFQKRRIRELERRLESVTAGFAIEHEKFLKANERATAAESRLDDALKFKDDWHNPEDFLRINELERRLDDALSEVATLKAQLDNIAGSDLMARMDKIVTEGMQKVGAESKRIIEEELFKPQVVETSSPKTWDELVARNKAATLDDGFGNMWLKCDRGDCGLHIVRPGKVQCEHEQCPTSHKSE